MDLKVFLFLNYLWINSNPVSFVFKKKEEKKSHITEKLKETMTFKKKKILIFLELAICQAALKIMSYVNLSNAVSKGVHNSAPMKILNV